MMKYKIKYTYQTGDSYGTSQKVSELEESWGELEVVKANLQRIKDHYEYYKVKSKSNPHKMNDLTEKKVLDNAPSQDWFVGNFPNAHYCLKLYLDNGNVWQISAPWCGYFEHLISCEIIIDDSDMKFEF